MNRPLPHRLSGVVADARKVTPLQFMDAVLGTSPEQRKARHQQTLEQCIGAIERGDTWAWPPLLVHEARELMAQRATLVEVERLPKRNGRARIAA